MQPDRGQTSTQASTVPLIRELRSYTNHILSGRYNYAIRNRDVASLQTSRFSTIGLYNLELSLGKYLSKVVRVDLTGARNRTEPLRSPDYILSKIEALSLPNFQLDLL